jgi:hypothetical protein
MINVIELTEKLTRLAAIATGNEWEELFDASDLPQNFAIVQTMSKQLFPGSGFLQEQGGNEGVLFHIPRLSPFPLLVKKEHYKQEDPPLFIVKDKQTLQLLPTSSIVLATEFAFRLFEIAHHKHAHNGVTKIYPQMRQQFTLFCKEGDYPNKIWLHKESNSFNLVLANEEKIYFVAASSTALQALQTSLQLTNGVVGKTNGTPFPSDFVMQGTIFDNTLSGQIILPGEKQPIAATFGAEDDDDKSPNFSTLVSKSRKIASQLTKKEIKNLAKKVAGEITDAAYNQSDYTPTEKDYTRLSDSIELTAINFYGDEAVLVFESKPEFPGKKIFTQVDRELEIVDVSIN